MPLIPSQEASCLIKATLCCSLCTKDKSVSMAVAACFQAASRLEHEERALMYL